MSEQTAQKASNRTNQNQSKDSRSSQSQEERSLESTGEDFYDMVTEVSDSVQKYCKQRPKVVAGIIFGLGFVVGWKLKPW